MLVRVGRARGEDDARRPLSLLLRNRIEDEELARGTIKEVEAEKFGAFAKSSRVRLS